jgi:hypothetical protein
MFPSNDKASDDFTLENVNRCNKLENIRNISVLAKECPGQVRGPENEQ